MATYIVLLGPPGSGKGTQARLVADRFCLPHISTGDLFRAMKTQDTPLAHKVQDIIAQGALVPDDITIEIVKERLSQPDCRAGATLDGFPRTVRQAEALDRLLEESFKSRVSIAPLLDVEREEVIQRILGRSRQEGRADDTPEVAQKRYEVYLESTRPLIDYYHHKGVLVKIGGSQPIPVVTEELMAAVEKRIKADQAVR